MPGGNESLWRFRRIRCEGFYQDGFYKRKFIQITPEADFYPTLLSMANAAWPDQVLDGVDLSSSLLGHEKIKSRDIFWHFPIYLQAHNSETDQGQDPLFRTRPGSVLRSGNWKLIHYFEHNEYELYNLTNDVGEQNNLAEKLPNKLDELSAKLRTWRQEIGVDISTELNPEYDSLFNQQQIAQPVLKTE